jgi:hypothetical protein
MSVAHRSKRSEASNRPASARIQWSSSMVKYEDNRSGALRDAVSERRSVALLTLIVTAVFIACFVAGRWMPVLPAHVHEALAVPPLFSASLPS